MLIESAAVVLTEAVPVGFHEIGERNLCATDRTLHSDQGPALVL